MRNWIFGCPARFGNLPHHSIEGYGFIARELAGEANIRYGNSPNTVTYFGAVLFNEEKKGGISVGL